MIGLYYKKKVNVPRHILVALLLYYPYYASATLINKFLLTQESYTLIWGNWIN